SLRRHQGRIRRSRASSTSGATPVTSTRFVRLFAPDTIRTDRFGTSNAPAISSTSAPFAAPSTGAAASRTSSWSSRTPAMPERPARGVTRAVNVLPPCAGENRGTAGASGPRRRLRLRDLQLFERPHRGRLLRLGRAGAMQEHPLVALLLVLLANEVERVPEGRDARLERVLAVPPLQPQPVDLPLHLFEPQLRLVQQQIRAPLRLPDDPLRLVLGVGADLVGQPLRGEQRVAQVPLALPVLVEARLQAGELVAQPVGFTQRLFVVVGGLGQERLDLGAVVAAHHRPELLLPQIQRGHLHVAVSVSGRPALPGAGRSPKIAVPTRTMVAPSSTATWKSWLMPIDSSASRSGGTPSAASRSRSWRRRRNHGRTSSGFSAYGGRSISPTTRAACRSPAARRTSPTSASGRPNLVASPARSTWISRFGDTPRAAAA